MRPRFTVWLAALALVASVLAPATALAGPKPAKSWNIYQDKLGAFVVSTAIPKGQALIAGPFTTQAEAQAYMASPPVLLWTGDIEDGETFFVPDGIPPAPVVTVVGELKTQAAFGTQVDFSGHGTEVGSHLMVASATDVFGLNTTQQRGFTVNLKPAELAEPLKTDESFQAPGIPNPGSIFIPEVEGLEYFIDGVSKETGTYPFYAGTHLVTMEVLDGYELIGTYPEGGWSLTIGAIDVYVDVTPEAPTARPEKFVSPGVESPGGIEIPATVGVNYFVDGELATTNFVERLPGSYLVTAQPQDYYRLVGQHSWTLEVIGIDPTVHVTPGVPTVTHQSEFASAFITIPDTTGVNYAVDGVLDVPVGPYTVAPGSRAVVATPESGYALDGVTSWTLTAKAWVPFTLTAGGFAYQYGLPTGYPALTAPVVDNVAHTITWTQPVNSAANPTYYSYFIGTVPNIPLGSYDVAPIELGDKNLANGELGVKVSATLSPSLAGQESKFRLVYQSTVYNNPLSNVTAVPLTLPVTNFDLRGPSSLWDDAVGGHTNPYPGQFETGVAALWSGVTGTGEITITLTFSSY